MLKPQADVDLNKALPEIREKAASPQPIEQLTSHVDELSPHLRFTVAIACKLASLLILSGRFTADVQAEEEDEETLEDVEKEQHHAKKLQRDLIDEAMRWLVLVCRHLSVDISALPEDPTGGIGRLEELPHDQHFAVAFELVLVSIGLAASASKEGTKDSEKAEKAGQDDTSPLNYTSSARTLLVRTCGHIGISPETVEHAERSISQTLFFQLQKTEEKKNSEGKTIWDAEASAAREKEDSSTKKAIKWAATGAGFVLGGVAIGLTGGTSIYLSTGALFFSVCTNNQYLLSGLAAPAFAPLLAGTLGMTFFGTAGGAMLIGTLLGLGGGTETLSSFFTIFQS
jgi:hypothetical protein